MEDSFLPKEKVNINQIRPNDRVDGYPINTHPFFKKVLELIPGIVTWLFILSPLIFSLLKIPQVLVFYIAFLMVYWLFRGFRFFYGLITGVQRMKRDVNEDWAGKIKKECTEKYKTLNFVYLCPTYHEGEELLRSSLQAVANSDYESKKISVLYAIEEKYCQKQIEIFQKLKIEYGSRFKEMICFVHPADIEGEIVGVKGANINWATRQYVKHLKTKGEDIHDYLLISVDSDWRPHPKLLSAIAYKYMTTPNPDHKFYASAIHTFNNNLWKVPSLIRAFSTTSTLVILHNWVVSRVNETFSAYVANLKTIDETGYWAPDIQNDDTAFYWNALVRYNGDFKGVPVFIPTYSDAVENETYVKTHKSLYKQQHRWGWGVIVFPITIAALLENKHIPFLKKLSILEVLLENRLIYLTVVYLLTLGLPLLNILSSEYVYSSASFNLPKLMSYLMTALMFLNLPVIIIRKILYPKHAKWNIFRHIWDYIETFLITINMLTFTFIPYIQANTELMLGRKTRKKLYITEKTPM
jgi:cellulose synthase/poly-beta-1,6-N-acetylglucosamine synthase-like glycosyltransferase